MMSLLITLLGLFVMISLLRFLGLILHYDFFATLLGLFVAIPLLPF